MRLRAAKGAGCQGERGYAAGMADETPDHVLARVLSETKVIALVGASTNPSRASHGVMGFLLDEGYDVIPVNPLAAGQTLFGRSIVANLDEASRADMVDIFRRSEAVPEIVETALCEFPNLKTIWMQLGVSHRGAAAAATERGVTVIQNRCPKIEIARLRASITR